MTKARDLADGTFSGDVTVSGNITSTGIDDNATSTAMTLDSSGNAIIGGTSAGQDGAVTLSNTGYIQARIDNDTVAYFDRTGAGDDGEVIRIQQNGSTVGVIGTVASEVYIGNGDTGLYFASGNNDIRPFNTSTQNSVDNSIDLGRSATRFKDLYLSGGVYVGGTGSANLLDDYEEGNWTPTLSTSGTDFSSVTYAQQHGHYTKIGRSVTVTMLVQISTYTQGSGSGNVLIAGLPFSVSNSSGAMYSQWLTNDKMSVTVGSGYVFRGGYFWKANTKMVFLQSQLSGTNASQGITISGIGGNFYMYASGTYFTDS